MEPQRGGLGLEGGGAGKGGGEDAAEGRGKVGMGLGKSRILKILPRGFIYCRPESVPHEGLLVDRRDASRRVTSHPYMRVSARVTGVT